MKKCPCGKTAYGSREKARAQANWIARKGKKMRVYQCEVSFAWHLTSDLTHEHYGDLKCEINQK